MSQREESRQYSECGRCICNLCFPEEGVGTALSMFPIPAVVVHSKRGWDSVVPIVLPSVKILWVVDGFYPDGISSGICCL